MKQWKTSFPKVIALESCEILNVDFKHLPEVLLPDLFYV